MLDKTYFQKASSLKGGCAGCNCKALCANCNTSPQVSFLPGNSLYTHTTRAARVSKYPAEEKAIFESEINSPKKVIFKSEINSPKILIHGTWYYIFYFDLCCHLDKTRFQVVSSLKPRQSNAMRWTLYTSHITVETRSRKLLAENCTRCFSTPPRPLWRLASFCSSSPVLLSVQRPCGLLGTGCPGQPLQCCFPSTATSVLLSVHSHLSVAFRPLPLQCCFPSTATSVLLSVQRPWGLLGTGSPGQPLQCCFPSTATSVLLSVNSHFSVAFRPETVRIIRDGLPRTATSVLLYVHRDHKD